MNNMRILLLLTALPVLGAQDTNALLTRMVAAELQNSQKAQHYTYTEEAQYFSYDKYGQGKKITSKHEILFIEGVMYRRLVARNGQPLSKREEAREQKKMQQTAAERRKQLRSRKIRTLVSLGGNQELLTLFDSRLVGEEEVGGRRAWVIECTPKAGHVPANVQERQALSFHKKLWIDQMEHVELKRIDTVVGDQIVYKPGTVITFEFEQVNGDVWLPSTQTAVVRIQVTKIFRSSGRTEVRYANYRKFNVESTITLDEPE